MEWNSVRRGYPPNLPGDTARENGLSVFYEVGGNISLPKANPGGCHDA